MGYLQLHLVSLWPNGTYLQTYNDCVLCAQKHRSLSSSEQEYIIIRALLLLTVTVYHLFAQDSN